MIALSPAMRRTAIGVTVGVALVATVLWKPMHVPLEVELLSLFPALAYGLTAVALVLITAVASFPSNLLSSIGRFFDDSIPRSSRQTTSAAALKQGKTEAVVIKPAPLRNSDATASAPSGPSTHANEPPKKRQRRNIAKASAPKPPAFSITPN